MGSNRESGFVEIILLLGFAALLGSGYLYLSKNVFPQPGTQQTNPDTFPFQQLYPSESISPTEYPESATLTPTIPLPTISPFVLQPLTITLTDTQFTQFVNTYKPNNLPVSDITFVFSDNTIEATTVANSQVIQGPIKIVAMVENKWFTITKVYLGTYELPPELTAQVNTQVQESFKRVLASLYLDGLQIESVKGHTMKLSLHAPKGYVQKEGSLFMLNSEVFGTE